MAHTIFHVNTDHKGEQRKSPELRQVTRAQQGATLGKKTADKRRRSPWQQSRRVLSMSVGVIVIVFAALLILLYNQSRIIEVNFANAALQRQINLLTKENAQRREEISKSMDLGKIRTEAERLGLQTPLESQVIEIKQSQRDQIVINLRSANAEGVDPGELDMTAIFANVEGFFKTIR